MSWTSDLETSRGISTLKCRDFKEPRTFDLTNLRGPTRDSEETRRGTRSTGFRPSSLAGPRNRDPRPLCSQRDPPCTPGTEVLQLTGVYRLQTSSDPRPPRLGPADLGPPPLGPTDPEPVTPDPTVLDPRPFAWRPLSPGSENPGPPTLRPGTHAFRHQTTGPHRQWSVSFGGPARRTETRANRLRRSLFPSPAPNSSAPGWEPAANRRLASL